MKLRSFVITLAVTIATPMVAPSAQAFDLSTCTINGTTGNDTLQGTSGDDVICGKGGYDVINAGAGNDIVYLSSGQTADVNLEDGNDYLDASAASAVNADGGAGNDELIGSPGNDTLSGGLGAEGDEDIIYAGGGNDTVDGEDGEILIVTLGDGDDTFNGGDADSSTVLGGDGEDTITGTPGIDDLSGNGADDVIWGVSGADVITGGNGDDIIAGGDGVDTLDGGWGLNNCDYTTNEPRTTTCVYDDAGPTLISLSVNPSSVDVTNSDQTVHVDFSLSDQTGVRYAYVYCYSTTGNSQKAAIQTWIWINDDKTFYTYDYNSNISETHPALDSITDFTLSFDATVLKGHKPDTYSCYAYANDVLNQYGWFSPVNPVLLEVTRTGTNYDDYGPVFESLTFTPDTVEVGSESQTVTVNAHLTDQTGVKYGFIYCWGDALKSPLQLWFSIDDNYSYVYDYASGNSSNLTYTGNRQDLYLELNATVPKGQKPGVYSCSGYAYDDLNLYSWYNPVTYPTLNITRVGQGFDDLGPQIYDFTITPNVVEVGAADAPVDINFTLYDQSGINYGYIYCWGDSNKSPLSIWFDLDESGYNYAYDYNTQESAAITVTGDAQNVSISLETVVQFGTKPGTYTCGGYAYDSLNQYGGFYEQTNPHLTVNRTPPGQPGSPTSLQYVPDSSSSGILSWNAPEFMGDPQLKDYQVQFSMDGSNWTTIDDGYSVTPSLPISNLNGGTNYWFRVRGDNGGGEGAWSEVIQITTPQPTLPSSPVGLNVSDITPTSFTLDWQEPLFDGDSKITNFIVEVSSDNGNSWSEIQHMESSATSMKVNGLKANTDYQVRVSSVNIVGASSPSDHVAAKTIMVPTSKPLSLSAKTVTATSVTLQWKAPTNLYGSVISDYLVELSRDDGATWETVNKPVSTSTSLTISGLGKGRAYVFRVAAINAAGASDTSIPLSVTTSTTIPAAVTNLELVIGYPTNTSVKVTWLAPIDRGGLPITDYKIQYSRNGGRTWVVVEHAPSTKRTLKLDGLKSGRNYLLRVKAVTDKGASPTWTTISFTTSS